MFAAAETLRNQDLLPRPVYLRDLIIAYPGYKSSYKSVTGVISP